METNARSLQSLVLSLCLSSFLRTKAGEHSSLSIVLLRLLQQPTVYDESSFPSILSGATIFPSFSLPLFLFIPDSQATLSTPAPTHALLSLALALPLLLLQLNPVMRREFIEARERARRQEGKRGRERCSREIQRQ